MVVRRRLGKFCDSAPFVGEYGKMVGRERGGGVPEKAVVEPGVGAAVSPP